MPTGSCTVCCTLHVLGQQLEKVLMRQRRGCGRQLPEVLDDTVRDNSNTPYQLRDRDEG